MTRFLDFENDKRQIKSFRMAGKVAMCSSLPFHRREAYHVSEKGRECVCK